MEQSTTHIVIFAVLQALLVVCAYVAHRLASKQ
jgi:hypothetical protein